MALCECGCGQPAGVYASTSNGRRKGEPKRFVHGHGTRGRGRARDEAIVAMARDGRPSYRVIGERFGISPSRVGEILGEHGERNPASGAKGPDHPRWNGGRAMTHDGYVSIKMPEHPRANPITGYVREHIIVAEAAFGGPLPDGAVVHHVDEDRTNNTRGNLVVCQDNAYHSLLHRRMRAMEECGHPDWFQCRFCREWAPAADLYVAPRDRFAHHRPCAAAHMRSYNAARREAA